MKKVVLAASILAALSIGLTAQTRPDFSGTWKRDAARSDSATYPELAGPVTLTITHTADHVQIERTTSRGAMVDTFKFAQADKPAAAGVPIARWRGDTLLLTQLRDIRGQSVNVEQAFTLKGDAKELFVESTVNVQHGYTTRDAKSSARGRDVYVKAAGSE